MLPASTIDPVITIYNLLKNNWTETNPDMNSINLVTSPVDVNMAKPPTIAVYRPKSSAEARWVRAPWRVVSLPLSIGQHPTYMVIHPVRIDIILKASDVNDAGLAKQQKWNMINEVQRILMLNAYYQDSIQAIEQDSYWEDDDYTTRPILITGALVVRCQYFISG